MPGLLTILAYTMSVTAGLSLGDERHHAAAVLVALAGAVQLLLRVTRTRRPAPGVAAVVPPPSVPGASPIRPPAWVWRDRNHAGGLIRRRAACPRPRPPSGTTRAVGVAS